MNKAKLILALGTLGMTIASTLVIVGVRAFEPQTAAAEEPLDQPSPEQAILGQQADLEAELSDMQASEADYIDILDEANAQIAELNAQLEALQSEAYTNQADLQDLQNNINLAYATGSQYAGEVQAMQAREGQWQEALTQANQTIAELEAYITQYQAAASAPAPSGGGSGSSGGGGGGGSHFDDDEHQEQEHEEHDD